MPKRQFCLGSITKCHVIRSSGGLQSKAEQKLPFENPSCGFFHNGAMVLLEFRFWLLASANSQDGLQGVDWKSDASLASRLYPIYWGALRELGTV